jgi:hypothetical protein
MKAYANKIFLLPLLAILPGVAVAETAEKTAARTVATAVVASAESTTPAPQSVFVIPASAKEGRNPFFPRSRTEAPVVAQKPDANESASLVLNGITSLPKRTAMINGRTFEAGETGEVKLQNGEKISIRCVEIRDDAAIVVVGAQRRELRIRTAI